MELIKCQTPEDVVMNIKLFMDVLHLQEKFPDEESLHQYGEKVIDKGECWYVKEKEEILAMNLYYVRDVIENIGFASMLAANPKNNGLYTSAALKMLFDQYTKDYNAYGLKGTRLEVNKKNLHAMQMYGNMGFVYEKDASEDSIYMISTDESVNEAKKQYHF